MMLCQCGTCARLPLSNCRVQRGRGRARARAHADVGRPDQGADLRRLRREARHGCAVGPAERREAPLDLDGAGHRDRGRRDRGRDARPQVAGGGRSVGDERRRWLPRSRRTRTTASSTPSWSASMADPRKKTTPEAPAKADKDVDDRVAEAASRGRAPSCRSRWSAPPARSAGCAGPAPPCWCSRGRPSCSPSRGCGRACAS